MPNPWIIHVRAAHYLNDEEPEHHLKAALTSMLRLAHDNTIRSLAMPAIGTGVFKFPLPLAARLTAQVLSQAEETAPYLQWIRICLADQAIISFYETAVNEAKTVSNSTV